MLLFITNDIVDEETLVLLLTDHVKRAESHLSFLIYKIGVTEFIKIKGNNLCKSLAVPDTQQAHS